jgi:hypothetical protein
MGKVITSEQIDTQLAIRMLKQRRRILKQRISKMFSNR